MPAFGVDAADAAFGGSGLSSHGHVLASSTAVGGAVGFAIAADAATACADFFDIGPWSKDGELDLFLCCADPADAGFGGGLAGGGIRGCRELEEEAGVHVEQAGVHVGCS